MKYYPLVPNSNYKIQARHEMVKYAKQFGISAASDKFETTRVTVRKWCKRFDGSLRSLADKSKAPKRIPHKITRKQEQELLDYRRKFNRWGPDRIKNQFDLPYSTRTIARVFRQHGLNRSRKKKYKAKRDLREIKEKLAPFEVVQVDVKYLDDIEEFYENWFLLHLPRFEYTARDVRTGITFFSYAYEKTNLNASYFIEYVLLHLQRFGFPPQQITIQTDNGTEFVAPPKSKKVSMFEKTVASFGAKLVQIPPASPTFNSDVETFHRLIEDEFYTTEHFDSRNNFIAKSFCYQIYFNLIRKNRYKKNQTPNKILENINQNKHNPRVSCLNPIILDPLIKHFLPGYHVCKADNFFVNRLAN